jgi:hypothetical protein
MKEPINFAHFCPCVYSNLNADEKEGRRGNISEETHVFLAVVLFGSTALSKQLA